MKTNANTRIVGDKVILVPYRKEHVPKYHKWMENEQILELTASERLSLEEEYEMQKSWYEDDNKLTFILIDKTQLLEKNSGEDIVNTVTTDCMCGDVNIFFSEDDETNLTTGEMEIMIAEETSRGRGIATESLWLMMRYAIENLKVDIFEAKILEQNTASLALFKDKMGYHERRFHEVFREHWLEYRVCDGADYRQKIVDKSQHAITTKYE